MRFHRTGLRRPRYHRVRHNVVVLGCATCMAEVDATWAARAARGWTTDPSDPGWRQEDADHMRRPA